MRKQINITNIFSYLLIFSKPTGIEDNAMLTADWESSCVNEFDISSTELTENCLLYIFSRLPKLTYLAVPNCDGFTDQVNILCHILFLVLIFLLYVFRVQGS